MSSTIRDSRDSKNLELMAMGLSDDLALRVANLQPLSAACDIIHVAAATKLDISVVASIYYRIGARFKLAWLRVSADNLESKSHWKRLSIQAIIEKLYDIQMVLTQNISTLCVDCDLSDAFDKWLVQETKNIGLYDKFIESLHSHEEIDEAMLTVATFKCERLIK